MPNSAGSTGKTRAAPARSPGFRTTRRTRRRALLGTQRYRVGSLCEEPLRLPLADADTVAALPALAVDKLPPVMRSHSGAKALLSRSLDSAVSSWVVHESDSLATLTTCPVRARAREPLNV